MTHAPRFGIGFRTRHFAELAAAPRCVDWLELLSENYLGVGGPRRAQLEQLRASHVVALHGVSLGIANDHPPREDYLPALRELADFVEPAFVSDHLCWTGFGGRNSHDLLPVAFTRELLALVAERVDRVQEALGRRLLLENASAYVALRGSEMTEAELFAELCARSGCGMLLDVNNLIVNAANLGVDARRELAALRPEHVAYLHLAGHTLLPDVRIDSHGADVPREVWSLFAEVARRFPHAHVILERDDAIPPLAELVREVERAREVWRAATKDSAELCEPSAGPSARPSRGVAAAGEPDAPHWHALQRDFWWRVADRPPRFDHSALPGLGALLDAERPVTAARGMRVYSDAHAATLRAALATNFPTLARVLSARDLTALAATYAAHHPSASHDYLRFGARLADFVRNFAFADAHGIPQEALADLVRLEHAQLEVQEARDDAPGIPPAALAALAPEVWERARFLFARAHRIVFCSHAVLPAVRAGARGEAPERPRAGRVAYLVTRQAGVAQTDELDRAAAAALASLADGAHFADACEKAGGEPAVEAVVAVLALACARGAVLEVLTPSQRAR